MTGRRPPAADWDDRRLNLAFRAGYGGEAPTGLIERVVADLDRPRPVDWLSSIRRSSLGLLGATAVVVLLLLGSQAGLVTPGLQTGSPRPPSGLGSPAPTDDRAQFPPTVVAAKTGETLPVLSVEQALVVRDGGVDSRERAVGGWFIRIPVPCPLWLGPVSPLSECGTNFTWLMADPEPLTSLAGSGEGAVRPPQGPAFNVFTSWTPDRTQVPIAVVFVGHFDDAQAAKCSSEQHQVCADRFVVDQVGWSDEALPEVYPESAEGLPVVTVDEAIRYRERDASTELAVAGWYTPPPVIYCSFIVTQALGPLQEGCLGNLQWLTAEREPLFQTAPGETSLAAPTGPALHIAFSSPRQSAIAADTFPVRIILIGHFNDRRALLCDAQTYDECRHRFVVDAVEWVDAAHVTVPNVLEDPSTEHPPLTAMQQAGVEAFFTVRRDVLNRYVATGAQMSGLEPALAQSDLGNAETLSSEPILWLATVVEPIPGTSEPVVRSYVIDTRGTLYVAAAGGFVVVVPEPTPS